MCAAVQQNFTNGWMDLSVSGLPEGPAVWICGDCHSGNIGPIANSNGNVAMGIRDIDQTVIGNPAHDLIRLGLSLAMSARDSNLSGVITTRILEELMAGYKLALQPSMHTSDDLKQPSIVNALMKKAMARSWTQLAKERIGGVSPEIPLGKRFWPLTKAERKAVFDLFAQENCTELKAALRPDGAELELKVIDAAFWMKGCSSLGFMRYAALVKFKEEKRLKTICIWSISKRLGRQSPRAMSITKYHATMRYASWRGHVNWHHTLEIA
jgi:uncharacterized protein (DUF2252 family)